MLQGVLLSRQFVGGRSGELFGAADLPLPSPHVQYIDSGVRLFCLQVSSALNDMASRSKYLPPPQRSLLQGSHCNVADTLHVQETRSDLGDNTDFSEPEDEEDAGTIRLQPLLSIHVQAGIRISRTNGSTR